MANATDFARCKETIEDAYCGEGDQALVVTLGGDASLTSGGNP